MEAIKARVPTDINGCSVYEYIQDSKTHNFYVHFMHNMILITGSAPLNQYKGMACLSFWAISGTDVSLAISPYTTDPTKGKTAASICGVGGFIVWRLAIQASKGCKRGSFFPENTKPRPCEKVNKSITKHFPKQKRTPISRPTMSPKDSRSCFAPLLLQSHFGKQPVNWFSVKFQPLLAALHHQDPLSEFILSTLVHSSFGTKRFFANHSSPFVNSIKIGYVECFKLSTTNVAEIEFRVGALVSQLFRPII